MLNRRKAVIGWLVYSAAKPLVKNAVKDKAKKVKPGTGGSSRRVPKLAATAAGLGAAAGALVFWRSRSGDDEPPSDG
jgi:hypothetical protein